jgi:hypothetical protein
MPPKRLQGGSLPAILENAPMAYAPVNELGVVLLFSDYARKHRIKIDRIRGGFPDCIAFQSASGSRKRCRIEFEFRSSNFARHGHDPRGCDWIVCWEHDWRDAPHRLRIVALRREYGMGGRVWIENLNNTGYEAKESFAERLKRVRTLDDAPVPSRANQGDLVLYRRDHFFEPNYECAHDAIETVCVVQSSPKKVGIAGVRWTAPVQVLCRVRSLVWLRDFLENPILRTAPFFRRDALGGIHFRARSIDATAF